MIAVIYNRVSTEKQQQEGLSLQTQRAACIKYAQEHGYDVREKYIVDEVYSGLTLDRPKLDTLLGWVKAGEVQAIVIYSVDRFSRDGYDLLTLMRDCDINKAKLLCVSEDLGEGKIGELLNFVKGWASGLEASRFRERSLRNKRAMAKRGEIPSGYGRYGGYLGLQYDPSTKTFKHIPGQTDVACEILERYARGESCLSITKSLHARNFLGPSGKLIAHGTVNGVLAHARVYTGIISWGGIEIRGKVEPIISEEVANTIQRRLRLNREHSFGYGKRKWFTGRVFCGVCGHRYVIQQRKGCTCNGSNAQHAVRCNSPRVPYRVLERLLTKALLFTYADEEAVIGRATEAYHNWQQEIKGLQDRQEKLEQELNILTERRRRVSVQHEMGGITDEEYADKLKAIKSREDEVLEAVTDIQRFKTDSPIPADPEKVRVGFNWLKMLGEMEPFLALLGNSPDKHKIGDQLADALGFRATVLPDMEKGFRLEVRVNIPLEPIELEEQSASAMVLSTSLYSGKALLPDGS